GVGLFGSVSGEVRDVNLEGAVVYASGVVGARYTGALVGDLSGRITGSSVTGRVYGAGAAGGLVGRSSGIIEDCRVTGEVSTRGDAGGIAAWNYGDIRDPSFSGSVQGKSAPGASPCAGGLVGWNYGDVVRGFASADVYGGPGGRAGGLVGYNVNGGGVSHSLAVGSVSAPLGAARAGGLAGENGAGGVISDSSAEGVTLVDTGGGLVSGDALFGGRADAAETPAGWPDETVARMAAGIGGADDIISIGEPIYNHLLGTVSRHDPTAGYLPLIISSAMSRVAPFGGSLAFVPKNQFLAKRSIESASRFVPSSWIRWINGRGGLRVEFAPLRGYYNGWSNVIKIDVGGVSTALHELMHAVWQRGRIAAILRDFYDRRTEGSPLTSLRSLTANPYYGPGEMAREGGFINPYMGYEDGREILSMGAQYVLWNRGDIWNKDPEYTKFILGIFIFL
ncbi:MAG: hypothetical protein LBQ56_03525, partial [Synergistaceae bacterium]|nr:hypothetical protein [Synergistaceae bacterium]